MTFFLNNLLFLSLFCLLKAILHIWGFKRNNEYFNCTLKLDNSFINFFSQYWVPKVSKKYVRIPIGKLADALPEVLNLSNVTLFVSRVKLSVCVADL